MMPFFICCSYFGSFGPIVTDAYIEQWCALYKACVGGGEGYLD